MTGNGETRDRGGTHLIAKGAGIVFTGAAVGSALRYVFHVAAARGLGAETFGLWTLGFIIYKILAMAAEFGLPQGLIRHVSAFRAGERDAELKGVILSGLKMGLLTGSAAAVLGLALAGPISSLAFGQPELAPIIRLFSAALLPATLGTILLAAGQGFKTMVPTVIVRDFWEPALRLLIAGAAFLAGAHLFGVTFAYVLAAAIALVLAWRAIRRIAPFLLDPALPSKSGSKVLREYAWPLFLIQGLSFLIQWTGTLVLGLFQTPVDVGVFGAAIKTALLGSLSRNAFHSIYQPIVSEYDSRGRREAMGETYRTVAKWVFSLNLPLFVGLILFARPVLRLFGSEFEHGRLPLAILGAGWIIYSAVGPAGETLIMTGRQKLHLLNMAATFAVNISLCLWLVPSRGAAGAATALAVAMSLYAVATGIQVRFIAGVRPIPGTIWKPIVAGAASAGAVLAAAWIWPALGAMFIELPAGIAGGAAFGTAYAAILLLLGMDDADRRILEKVKSRIIPERVGPEEDPS